MDLLTFVVPFHHKHLWNFHAPFALRVKYHIWFKIFRPLSNLRADKIAVITGNPNRRCNNSNMWQIRAEFLWEKHSNFKLLWKNWYPIFFSSSHLRLQSLNKDKIPSTYGLKYIWWCSYIENKQMDKNVKLKQICSSEDTMILFFPYSSLLFQQLRCWAGLFLEADYEIF